MLRFAVFCLLDIYKYFSQYVFTPDSYSFSSLNTIQSLEEFVFTFQAITIWSGIVNWEVFAIIVALSYHCKNVAHVKPEGAETAT